MLTVSLLAFVTVWNLHNVRRRSATPWPAIVVSLLVPFTIPVDWMVLRAAATIWAVVSSFKTWELARGGGSDPRMQQTLARAFLWLEVPQDSRVPDDDTAASSIRIEGRHRLRRALLKTPGALGLWALEVHWPSIHSNPWGEALWALLIMWLGMTAIIDVVAGTAMQSGIHVAEGFKTPPLARSPRDFWGHRWNLFVHRWFGRHVFRPVGGLRHPIRGTLIVFLVSGLVHEYVVAAAIGQLPQRIGWMTAFFLVHGIAVIVEVATQRRFGRGPWFPRPVAICLHLLWLTLTAPLFFGPLSEIFSKI